MGDKDESVSVEDMLRQAFRQYEEPDSMISVADQIVCAAVQGPRLYFTQVPSSNLTVTIGDGKAFEVEWSFGRFRSLLACFGGICGTVAEERFIRPSIEYVSAIDLELPCSGPYFAYVYLNVKQPSGTEATLRVQMQNDLSEYFLLIEPRKDTFNRLDRTIPKGSNTNAPNEPVSVEEMLRQTFQQYQEEPESLVSVADQILCLAMRTPKLYFELTPSKRLAISIGDGEAFEVELQDQCISRFRTLLACFGIICGTAAEKRSSLGEAKAPVVRTGLSANKRGTIRPTIEYVCAIIREEPGSPVSRVDADLDVRQPNGTTATLHLQTHNCLPGKFFLLIEPRKSTQ